LGCQPVAVVILHLHKYVKKKVTREFKSGGLNERHVVATWKFGNHEWENIKENIKTSAKASLGLHERKQHKPWFDQGCI